MKEILILGNGVSGITAARHIRKRSDHKITVVSGESDHFFARTALMYIYMGHMTYEHTKPYENWFWEKNRISLKRAWIQQVDTKNKQLISTEGERLSYDVLILALGSGSNKFGWPGQDLDGVQGLYSIQDLELMEDNTLGIQHACVVGGGLIGIEAAEMLTSRSIPTTIIAREEQYWDNVLPREEATLLGKHIREHGVDLRLETELAEILPGTNNRVQALRTNKNEEIECQFVVLTAGVHPRIDLIKDSEIETDRGILVDRYFKTNLTDVYAVGDCAQFSEPLPGRTAVEQLWYTGRMHGETVARTICETDTPYDAGPWFNSAKFFDIEYQVYGDIPPQLPENVDTLYWEHPDGRKCVRINYKKENKQVLGFNLFGIRVRHAVCEQWLREGRDMDYVLEHLKETNFDPEFFKHYETEVQAMYG